MSPVVPDVFEVCGHNPDQFIVGTFDDDDGASAQATAATSPTSSVVGSYNFRWDNI